MSEITIAPALETEGAEVLDLLRDPFHFLTYSETRYLHNFQNPDYLRHRQKIRACGFLLRDHGRPIGFTESIAREIWLKQKPLLACIGGTLYLKPGEGDSLPTLIYALIDQPAYDLNLTNTANKKSFEINRILRSTAGPESCAACRYRILSTTGYILFALGKIGIVRRVPVPFRKIVSFAVAPLLSLFPPFRFPSLPPEKTTLRAREITQITPEIFDPFWETLLADNRGLLTSRRTDVLRWTFGEGLKTGRYSMLGRFEESGVLRGAITLERRRNEAGDRYRVVDWIALRKEESVLGDLLRDAIFYARRKRAFLLELIGFEKKVQPLIAAYFPNHRPLSHRCNTFFMRFKDKDLRKECRQLADEGWFYGPFDGDSCWV
jgi:hypothetical protein